MKELIVTCVFIMSSQNLLISQSLVISSDIQEVWEANFVSDGRYIFCGGKTNNLAQIKLMEFSSLKEISSLCWTMREGLNALSLSPNKEYYAISMDNQLHWGKVYPLKSTYSLIDTTQNKYGKLSLSNNHLLAYHSSEKIDLWELATNKHINTFKLEEKEGRYMYEIEISANSKYMVVVYENYDIELWNVEQSKIIHLFESINNELSGVNFTPDSNSLIFYYGNYVLQQPSKYDTDCRIQMWDIESQMLIREITGFSGIIFNKNGSCLFSTNSANDIILSDWHNEEKIQTYTGHKKRPTIGGIDPNNKYLLSYGNTKIIEEFDNGFSFFNNAEIIIWDLKNGEEIKSLRVKPRSPHSLKISKRNNNIVCGIGQYPFDDKLIFLNDQSIGLLDFFVNDKYITDMAISPSGGMLLIAGGHLGTDDHYNLFELWDITSKKKVWDSGRKFEDEINSVTVNWDSGLVITFNDRDDIDEDTYSLINFWDLYTGELIQNSTNFYVIATSAELMPNGKHFITLNQFPINAPVIWDVKRLEPIQTLNTDTIEAYRCASVSPDGKYLATAGKYPNHSIKLWDIQLGKIIYSLQGHSDYINDVAFTSDGKYLLSASDDGMIKYWNIEERKLVKSFNGHKAGVNSLVISSNDNYAISTSDDQTIKFWDLHKSEEICTFACYIEEDGSIEYVVISPDMRFDGTEKGIANIAHYVKDDKVITLSEMKEQYYTPGLFAELMKPLQE